MTDKKKMPVGKKIGRNLGRKSKNTFVTKSGQSIKLNRSIGDKIKARRAARAEAKAKRLAGMPKSRIKRFFYRLHPKRMYKYWFSREGAIMALKITGIGIIASFLLLVGLFAYFRKDLPNLKDISGNNIGGSIRYYDKTGQVLLWEDFDAVKRIPVQGDQMSQFMKDATVAVEDKEFFKHGGFDVRGITRAAINNFTGGNDTRQGGSTITQQLVRLTQEKVGKEQTYKRKVKELILSVELERSYTKQEILVGYLNTAPYGNVQYGVESASRDYFQKSAKDLTLAESAFLAAIPKSPSFYSPYGPNYNPEALVGRQRYVLDQMHEQGMITKEQRDEAKAVELLANIKEPKPKYEGIQAPWFVLTAKEHLEETFTADTVKRGGWKVTTSLDLNLQKIAEEQVTKGLVQVRRQRGDVAAFVVEDVKTGHVVALVGGADFTNPEHGQNNYVRAKLPPGSSFKPYDYVSLIENSDQFGAGSVLYDTVGPLDGYPCTRPGRGGNCLNNFDFRQPGPLTLRYALGGSRNIPAVKAMLTAGVDKTIETAEKLMADPKDTEETVRDGYNCYEDDELTKVAACYAASGIGDGAYLQLDEHVHGFATISRNGRNIPQTYILKIEDAAGKTVTEWQPDAGVQVVREESAYIVADMISDPNASYFGRKSHRFRGNQGVWSFGMKTGTTNDSKDGLLLGFSTQYSAGVWVGYHNRQVEMTGFMENMTIPIWEGFMQAVHRDLKPEERARPAGIQVLPAFVVRTHVGVGSVEPSPATDLYPSWFKKKTASNKKQTIDIISNKLATDCTPARAKKEINEGDPQSFSGDRFITNATNTAEKDDVHKCEDVKPGVDLLSAAPQGDGSYVMNVNVIQGTHPIGGNGDKGGGKLNLKIDGQVVKTVDVGGPGPVNISYMPDFDGDKSVSVEVVDSVLYDGQSGSLTISGGSSDPLEITDPDAGEDIGNGIVAYTVKWTGGSGPFSVILDGIPVATCQNIAASSCGITVAGTNGSNHSVTVNSSSGSDTQSFKK